jgi:hypothetical protein
MLSMITTRRSVVLIGTAALLASCAGVNGVNDDDGVFGRKRANLPEMAPLACDPGFVFRSSVTTSAEHIVALAPWAHDSGLRLGDRVLAIDGQWRGTVEERLGTPSTPARSTFAVDLDRDGQRVRFTLPCRRHWDTWEAWRELIVAGGRRDWSACVASAEDVERYQRFSWSEVLFVRWFCTAKMSNVFASRSTGLFYRYALALLQEEKYSENLEAPVVRTYLLSLADDLRRYDAPALAADLQAEFANALAAQRDTTRRRAP